MVKPWPSARARPVSLMVKNQISHLKTWQVLMRQKKSWLKLLTSLKILKNLPKPERVSPPVFCSTEILVQEKPCWPKRLPGKLVFPFFPSVALTLSRCTSALEPRVFVIFSKRVRKRLPVLYLLMKLMRLAAIAAPVAQAEMTNGNRH